MLNNFGFFPDIDKFRLKQRGKAKVALRPEEEVLQVYRQTAILLFEPLGMFFLGAVIPIYPLMRYGLFDKFFPLYLIWFAFIFVHTFNIFRTWQVGRYVVTSHRLIKISRQGWFKLLVIETTLDRILNVSYKTTGVLSSLFQYGHVEVQAVGLMEPIILDYIAEPAKIKDYLWDAHQEFVEKHGNKDLEDFSKIQEHIGYTKKNQKIL